MGPKKKAAKAKAPPFAKGDVVWVSTGKQHEEPAVCVEFDQTWTPEDPIDSADDEAEERTDGILVRFTVSNIKDIYPPESIRSMMETPDDEGGSSSRRSSRRSRRAPDTVVSTKADVPEETRSGATTSPFFDKKSKANENTNDPPVRTNSRSARRSVVTPSPKTMEEVKKDEISSKEEDLKPAAAKTTTTRRRNAKRAKAPAIDPLEDVYCSPCREEKKDEEEETEPKKKPAKAVPKKAVAAKAKAAPAKKKKNNVLLIRAPKEDDEDEEDEPLNIEGDSEDDDDDPVFSIEYSPSGRATCRRCDELIAKNEIRITHRPLFRGKRGFNVYRHLKCASFDFQIISSAQDVSGWSRIKAQDFKALEERLVEARKEAEEEDQEIQPDELVQAAFEGEIRPNPPPGVTATLLPFQVEGFSWMRHQEVNDEAAEAGACRGGILADEMGMGKTLQTISTICDNRPLLHHCRPGMKHAPDSPDLQARLREEGLWAKAKKEWEHEVKMNGIPKNMVPRKNGAARAGTLVVCPVIALLQWKSEIAKFTEENSLTVGVYHGPKRKSEMTVEMMSKYDIILTTYQCVEQDFRKMVSPNKVCCPNCGGKYKIDKLRVHLKYFCGDGAQRTEAQARQRRSSSHRGGPSGGGGRGGKGKKKPATKKAKGLTTPPSTASKKTIRVRASGDYESDSELSVEEETKQMTKSDKRPSRSAAKAATHKVKSSVSQWSSREKSKGSDDDDESSFGEEEETESSPSEDSESEDEPIASLARKNVRKKAPPKKAPTKRKASKITPSSDDESDCEDDAVARAREKQRKALENIKNKTKKAPAKKLSSVKKGKAGKKTPPAKKAKGTGKRKKFESSSESDDDDEDDDPLDGVDLNELAGEAMSGAKFSILHSFCWWRIVLDEAHFIKSRSSQTAAAAFSLTGIHRWCLSGTPLQNRVGELYSLIRFLQIDPMAHYFCRTKGCDCKSVHYRMKEGVCQHCGHRAFTHFSHFNKHILNVIQRDGYTGDGRRAMFKLKTEVLDKCLLRRTKETRAEDMNLPPRIVCIKTLKLHPKEEDFYNALYSSSRSSFDDYVAQGTLLNNYAHIFDLLTKMRQAVDHPYLIVYSKNNRFKELAPKGPAVANGSVDCDICHEPPTERMLSSCCGSGFCRSCVVEYIESAAGGDSTPCPSCERSFSINLNQNPVETVLDDSNMAIDSSTVPTLKSLSHVQSGSILRRINLAEFSTSSKIEVLVQDLIEMRKERPGSKALVFSQFVNMLDLIRWRLHSDPCLADMGLGVRILHGGMDVKSRDTAIKQFQNDPTVRVLLMSLKAGGVALNLTVASEVFLVDNWWNPAAEMQAIDRTHRLGQHRPIRATRYICEGTVEERVLQLQEKKRLVFDGTVGRDAGSLKMLTVNDMKALFC